MQCSSSHSAVSNSLLPHRLYSPWNSPGQNTGMGSLSLLQGIFPTQGLSPGLLHCRQILYQLSHQGSPCISTEPYSYSFTYSFTCWSSISTSSASADPTNLISKLFLKNPCYHFTFMIMFFHQHYKQRRKCSCQYTDLLPQCLDFVCLFVF